MSAMKMTPAWTAIPLFLILAAAAALPVWAGEGPEPPPIPRGQPLSYYVSLVDSKLAAFGTSMLTVPDGPDWLAGKTIHSVAAAMQDSDPGSILYGEGIEMGFDPPNGPRCIKIRRTDGYVRYMNRNRSFHTGSPCAAITESEAQSSFFSALGALGLPTTEWLTASVSTVVERSVDGEIQDPPTEETCEIERMVILTRKASNGYPVFEDEARASISNLHERARLLIDWPRFALATGLIMRTRAEVVGELAQKIWEAESNATGLGAMVDLEIAIGYRKTPVCFVPVARAAFADTYERYAGEVLYVDLAYNPSSGVGPEETLASVQFRVHSDPTAGACLLEFYLPTAQMARLSIVDVTGREVARLADGSYASGWHQLEWNRRDSAGRRAASGVYFARLWTAHGGQTRRILVIR